MQLALLAAAAGAGCTAPDDDLNLGVVQSEVRVDSFVSSSCSTSVVLALSTQVAEEEDCMMPGQMVPFEEAHGVQFNSTAILPYLGADARDDLYAAGDAGGTIQINSAFRSVVQQYLIRRWYDDGRCGITAAAQPGTSNHESGRALDVDNYSSRITVMGNHGWAHDVAGDPVHFDHLASPDIRGADVLAFQRLWNRNNAGDQIAEDGDYGPQTAARIAAAPAEGFPIGATCNAPPDRSLDVVDVVGPDVIAPGETATFTVHLKNTGTVAWSADAMLATADGAPSVLADPLTWVSDNVATTLGIEIAPGATAELVFDVLGPAVDAVTPIGERFTLVDGDAHFGAVPIAVTVDPADDPNVHDDGDDGDGDDDGPPGGASCSATGGAGSGWLALALIGLCACVRRRR